MSRNVGYLVEVKQGDRWVWVMKTPEPQVAYFTLNRKRENDPDNQYRVRTLRR